MVHRFSCDIKLFIFDIGMYTHTHTKNPIFYQYLFQKISKQPKKFEFTLENTSE